MTMPWMCLQKQMLQGVKQQELMKHCFHIECEALFAMEQTVYDTLVAL